MKINKSIIRLAGNVVTLAPSVPKETTYEMIEPKRFLAFPYYTQGISVKRIPSLVVNRQKVIDWTI